MLSQEVFRLYCGPDPAPPNLKLIQSAESVSFQG
jgi:hypothetical protein